MQSRKESIFSLQQQIKKQLGKLLPHKSRSLPSCSIKIHQNSTFHQTLKSTSSSRKLNSSVTLSSLNTLPSNKLEKQKTSAFILSQPLMKSQGKLKKKKSKQESHAFNKLKRGDTLPQAPGKLVSSTSLELQYQIQHSRQQQEPLKTAAQYEAVIEKYRKQIDKLQEIIQSMMQP